MTESKTISLQDVLIYELDSFNKPFDPIRITAPYPHAIKVYVSGRKYKLFYTDAKHVGKPLTELNVLSLYWDGSFISYRKANK